jgi:hypothetical protein
MSSKPPTITVELTIHKVNQLAGALKELRRHSDWTVERDWPEDDSALSNWTISDAESALVKRAEYAELIFELSGERIEEDPVHVANVRVARQRYDAFAAAEAARLKEDA